MPVCYSYNADRPTATHVVVPRGQLNTPCLPEYVCSDNALTCNTTSNLCQCKSGLSAQLDMCRTYRDLLLILVVWI